MTRDTLKSHIYTSILTGVLNGEFTVDSVLSEQQLSLKYKVSKAPVREALVELCSKGVLESIPRRGYRIVRYSGRSIREILEYRVMLETGCLSRSFESITPTQIKRLQSLVEGEFTLLSINDRISYWGRTMEFHLTLASFAENEFIYNQLDNALSAYIRAYMQNYWDEWCKNDSWQPSVGHRAIVSAIAEGNKAEAIRLLEKDIRSIGAYGP